MSFSGKTVFASAFVLLTSVALVLLQPRSPRKWKDDFDGKTIDESRWHIGPHEPAIMEGNYTNGSAAVVSGALHVTGSSFRLQHHFWGPLKLKALINKPAVDPSSIEHVFQFLPVQGGVAFSPGWRCDVDPYALMSASQAEDKLANWPGGINCFWNCSVLPVERVIEVSVDKNGMVSIFDSGGCKVQDMLWISTPFRIAVGCRLRMPEGDGFYNQQDARPQPCVPDNSAKIEWIEVDAAKAERDVGFSRSDAVEALHSISSSLPEWLMYSPRSLPPFWRRALQGGAAFLAYVLMSLNY